MSSMTELVVVSTLAKGQFKEDFMVKTNVVAEECSAIAFLAILEASKLSIQIGEKFESNLNTRALGANKSSPFAVRYTHELSGQEIPLVISTFTKSE
ncbi:unnamed protein product [Moneuplotes crassus]|uniref:Uncharacterized protein n=1 Tax=Euplotes crassus TaxID=5936 RepID=A0AAD1U5N8_EUPCR|nr:unnamed protein product [Moneuplotes crassus]